MTSFRISVTVLAVIHAVFAGFTVLVGAFAISDPERADQHVWITLDSETKSVLNHYIATRDRFSSQGGDLRLLGVKLLPGVPARD